MSTNTSLAEIGIYISEIIATSGPQTFVIQIWQHNRSTQVGPLRFMGVCEAIRILKAYHIHPPPQSASIQWCDEQTKEYNSMMVWNL